MENQEPTNRSPQLAYYYRHKARINKRVVARRNKADFNEKMKHWRILGTWRKFK